MNDKQADFFSVVHSPGPELADFAELCNALYERELHSLAHQGPNQLSLLKRKLSGLSYHIKHVAYYLCQHQAPLTVDTHNASFQHKQAAKSPGRITDEQKCSVWYHQHAALGLVVPVAISSLDSQHIELDSIDKVNRDDGLIHLNKHGWFDWHGNQQDEHTSKHITMLKPAKAIMQAACCGHVWNHKSRAMPRPLSLRELLLSAQIDWKRFTLKPQHTPS